MPSQLLPIPITSEIWNEVGVDLVGPLQAAKSGHKYLLTASCYCTKWMEAVPIEDKTAARVFNVLFKLLCEKGVASFIQVGVRE